jgi:hypothetical protein
MKIDPASPWNAELSPKDGGPKQIFDTPRCALHVWLSMKSLATLRVRDFYDREQRDVADLQLVLASDVLGPMGPDLVPVTPDRAAKFTKDHGGRAVAASTLDWHELEEAK